MADKPSRALVFYGDGLARFISPAQTHLNSLSSRALCGFLALPHSPAPSLGSCGSDLVRDTTKTNVQRTKRHLSATEEEILLACLKELIANGWKSDNGFRAGYLNKLEELMRKELPGTDLKGIPNIHSKIQTWKKNYNSLATMLKLSGIGFKDQMIDCSAEQLEQIVKLDPNAKSMRKRTWPMYGAWKEIFGKDRATGENAEDVVDAVNELFNKENRALEENLDYYFVSHEQLDDNNTGDNSACGSGNNVQMNSFCGGERGEAFSKSTGKKRKRKETPETVADVLREVCRDTNERLDKIAQRIGYEYDAAEAKKDAFALLDNIPDLSLDEKIDICEIFAFESERLLIFKGLPDSARLHYVQRLLKSKAP